MVICIPTLYHLIFQLAYFFNVEWETTLFNVNVTVFPGPQSNGYNLTIWEYYGLEPIHSCV